VLGNLINHHDVVRVGRKLRQGQVTRIVDKVRIRGADRVVDHWSVIDRAAQEWWEIPAVRRRWNTFASGTPETSFAQHVVDKWLSQRPGLQALSLGCGNGLKEIEWAKLGGFGHLTGIDISPELIEHATRHAKDAGMESELSFRASSIRDLHQTAERFDVVLGLHSLHHFDHIEENINLIADLLRPDGLLIVDEFVGPTKFQWTSAQMQAADSLLETLPPERRVLTDGHVKRRVTRPSLLAMRFDDPSEAIESGQLLPALRHRFTTMEERPYGGTVLHIALSGIAQNFLDDDPATAELLERCFAAEDQALPMLGHDFVYAVCSPRPQPAPG
jgi:2-polyprenyl-3-methyl-5-hydroxy-6-metoxy-1,4-benzoquinol methylase